MAVFYNEKEIGINTLNAIKIEEEKFEQWLFEYVTNGSLDRDDCGYYPDTIMLKMAESLDKQSKIIKDLREQLKEKQEDAIYEFFKNKLSK